jgi:hypothetical protein
MGDLATSDRYGYKIKGFELLTVTLSRPGSVCIYFQNAEKTPSSNGQKTNTTPLNTEPSLQGPVDVKVEKANPIPEDVSFNELVTLACQNKPNFYALFQERYPQLHQKLLTAVSDLRLSELTLCAYIYLDFSAKDISRYTFKSLRTIQARKSHLRKRLSISSYEDIYIWMKNLNSPDFKKPDSVVR